MSMVTKSYVDGVHTSIEHPYFVIGALKSKDRNVIMEIVGSVENINSKPEREFQVICNLYMNRFHWFYIVDGKSGVLRYSHGISNSLRFIMEG